MLKNKEQLFHFVVIVQRVVNIGVPVRVYKCLFNFRQFRLFCVLCDVSELRRNWIDTPMSSREMILQYGLFEVLVFNNNSVNDVIRFLSSHVDARIQKLVLQNGSLCRFSKLCRQPATGGPILCECSRNVIRIE